MSDRFPQEAVLRDGRRLLLRLFNENDVENLYQFFHHLPEDVRRFAWDRINNRALVESWGRELDYSKVLPVLAYDDVDDAIARANATHFGLGASLWTRDPGAAQGLAARLEAGSVWINRHGGNAKDVPFGGAKYSGYGREQGVAGLQSYMEMQVVAVPSA